MRSWSADFPVYPPDKLGHAGQEVPSRVVVYLDLIFLFNFAADGMVLLATAWTRKLKVRYWRIAAAAAIGAGYVVMMLFPELSFFFIFSVKVLFSVVMVAVAFGFGKLSLFLRNLAAFYLVNFAIAGGVFGLHYFFMPYADVMNGILRTYTGGLLYSLQVGVGFIVLTFVFMVWLFVRVFLGAKQREAVAAHTAPVEVRVEDFVLNCTGLVDTGNQLYDPLTKTPVMIVEASLWKDKLPAAWIKRIQSSDVETIVAAMGNESFIWQDRLRVVPYRGVNRSTQFMLALKPDEVKVIHGNQTIATGKVLIGFDGGTLSSDGSYQAIIHPMLLQA